MMIKRVCLIVLMVDGRLMSTGDNDAFAVAAVTSSPSFYSHST